MDTIEKALKKHRQAQETELENDKVTVSAGFSEPHQEAVNGLERANGLCYRRLWQE